MHRRPFVELQELCQHNYHRLLACFVTPGVPVGATDFSWSMRHLSKYTWQLDIQWQLQPAILNRPMDVRIHIYHDVRMAEVVQVQGVPKNILIKHPYPNPNGWSADEKMQSNQFLGELLLRMGQVTYEGQQPVVDLFYPSAG